MRTAPGAPSLLLPDGDRALLELLRLLKAENYHFVTPTPATHARVLARPGRGQARDLRDIFGWSLPFEPSLLSPALADCLRASGMLAEEGGRFRSKVRVSSLQDDLYLHSAYPTEAEDAVFFGPDSYRFADLITRELAPDAGPIRIADLGSGAGVGAIVAAKLCRDAIVLATDINLKALRLARINAAAAGATIQTMEGPGLDPVEGQLDVVMLNPPYILDEAGRAYRDGGGMHGGEVSLDLTVEAMDRLEPGGRIILYTGSAIVDGEDPLATALRREADKRSFQLYYREIDPDVFGEELARPHYRDVERIALVGAILRKPTRAGEAPSAAPASP